LDPFFGGGAVLFAKPPSRIETVNDLDGDVVNFFRVIQDPESCQELQSWLTYTPYSRQIYEDTFTRDLSPQWSRPGTLQSYPCRVTDLG